ncbi:MAG: hypothetical protein FD143_1258 [Ignavibacteria bacterium]|nr:MAG: hypothetical protein FD143_1258 [Ignavibacteria bacterium]KAF0160775.1 MAG: hypothetical protein FD188_1380 [Ignavibacteria bacterium]
MNEQKFLRTIFFTAVIAAACKFSFAQTKQQKINKTDSTYVSKLSESDSVKTKAGKSAAKTFAKASMLDSNFSSYKVSQNYLETTDYRFTEDFLVGTQSAFIKKLGNRGTPVEVSLYGLNSSTVVFLNEGTSIANRITNFSNLHFVQSESIEAIEVIPLPRGFLYGNFNIAAVNFISREPSTIKPYSRLRYYQAPEGEGFIDGIFNISPFKNLKAFIELTNHGADSYYLNSRFSNWLANIRLSYLLSPTETIRINYKHVKANTGLNGGVDLEETGKKYPKFSLDDVVYNNLTAAVRFPNRYITNTNNFIAATLITKAIKKTPAEFSFYFREELAEFRQNISGALSENVLPVSRDNKIQTLGARFRFDYQNQLIDLVSVTTFERDKYIADVLHKESFNSSLASSLITTLNLPGKKIIPSAFIKYFLTSQKSDYFGFGGDVLIKINQDLALYAGIANFNKPISLLSSFYTSPDIGKSQQIQTAELKASANFGVLNLSGGYFLINNSNDLISAFYDSDKLNDEAFYVSSYESSTQGLSLQTNFNIWKIHLMANSTLYLREKEQQRNGLPNFSTNGGLYYIDTLFNQNLKMKAGFNYYSIGSRYEQRIDFEKGISSSYFFERTSSSLSMINKTEFTPSFRLDFFFAGRIQDRAIVYFTWENILNSRFFDTPLYPTTPRSLRFGVAWEFLD